MTPTDEDKRYGAEFDFTRKNLSGKSRPRAGPSNGIRYRTGGLQPIFLLQQLFA